MNSATTFLLQRLSWPLVLAAILLGCKGGEQPQAAPLATAPRQSAFAYKFCRTWSDAPCRSQQVITPAWLGCNMSSGRFVVATTGVAADKYQVTVSAQWAPESTPNTNRVYVVLVNDSGNGGDLQARSGGSQLPLLGLPALGLQRGEWYGQGASDVAPSDTGYIHKAYAIDVWHACSGPGYYTLNSIVTHR
jgi:hypothetical protein